jgi:hypothetical protein
MTVDALKFSNYIVIRLNIHLLNLRYPCAFLLDIVFSPDSGQTL